MSDTEIKEPKVKKEKPPKTPKAPKQPKAPKEAKAKKAKKAKKSKYPDWYIGPPKPMKTKKFVFHKPTKKFWIGLGFTLVILAFLTYIVIRLVQVGKAVQPQFDYFEYDAESQPDSYIMENSNIIFELDPSTTQFTVTQKGTGKVWYSNPPQAKQDPLALQKEKNNMLSPMLLKYSTENGNEDTFDLYTNSIQRNFYSVEQNGDEIRVDYTIGQMDREYIFPLVMYQSDFDYWTEDLSKSDQRAVLRAYHAYSVDDFDDDELDAMLAKYPKMEDEDLYLVFENIQTFLKEQMEEIFASQGYTYEDYQESKEMYKESNIKEVPAFNVSVIYKLEENGFTVNIPFDEISYRLKYPITLLSVLPYFGAGGKEDTGYILVPEGGGALIDFNNGKIRQNGYYADCYGWDYAMDRKAVITETRASFPLFGISNDGSSFISYITQGAEYAGVTAEIAGKLGSYNYARFDYRMLHSEQYEVTTRTTNATFSFETSLPKGETISQSYVFVDSPSYVDMAKEYQQVLFADAKKTQNKNIPLAVELVGAIEKKQQVLGIPKTRPYALTSYKEAANIINQIEDLGIEDVNYKLSGFINGGIRANLMNKVHFVKQLGGASGFKKMLKAVQDTSAKLYLDGSLQTEYRTGLFGGFFSYRDAARFVSDELCKLYEYSIIWYGKDDTRDPYYLLRQSVRDKAADKFTQKASALGLDGISYKDNGKNLSSDFNDRRLTTRATARQAQVQKMQEANDAGLGIMINSGNDYALPYVDFITNMELHGNAYAIIDRTVPFYQIVMHGYKNYSGTAVNLAYEKDQIFLESAETGAGLLYTFMQAPASKLQETNYTEYYSSNFDAWKDQFEDTYNKYNHEISKVANSLIVDHEYVSEQVTKTTFDNGYVIYVNFGYQSYVTPSGKIIPDRDYRLMKAED
ncbi:MAG: hypothetical protein IKR64_06895 [Treponema sp.]|nr:hypothetical protein [Treponema sp.]